MITEPRFLECHRLAPFVERGTDVDVIRDLMIHDLDVIQSFIPAEVESVEAVGVPVLTPRVDIANARLRFTNGCIANVTASRVSMKRERMLRLFQPDAYVAIDYDQRRVRIVRREPSAVPGALANIIADEHDAGQGDPLRDEIAAFLAAVRDRTTPIVSGRAGLARARARGAHRGGDRARDVTPAAGDPRARPDVLLIAGEASGDLHGADLVTALRARVPAVRVRGIGGAHLRAPGWTRSSTPTTLSTMGLVEARERLGVVWRAYRRMRRIVRDEKPDLVILIDFAEFNLALAGVAKRHGVPVLYYISPQVWAWRRGRVRKIARRVSRLAVVFPFEVPLYAGTGVRADFVGHPLLDRVRVGARPRGVAGRARPRSGETARGAPPRQPEQGDAAPAAAHGRGRRRGCMARGDCQCALALADTLSEADIAVSMRGAALRFPVCAADLRLGACERRRDGGVRHRNLGDGPVGTPDGDRVPDRAADLRAARRLVSVPFIGMPNLIAGRAVVPELIQDEATGERMAAEVARFLDDPAHAEATRRGSPRCASARGRRRRRARGRDRAEMLA